MESARLLDMMADHFGWLVIAGCFLGAVSISAVTRIVTTVARERSRREIAAYIAEGSLTPEQGERLIRADVNQGHART